jgi:hopanoid biosynthesis associated radical SAM protein HpnH
MEVFVGVPLSQMWTVAKYVLTQRIKGVKRYPLVLMLEPLFRCNLACAGCGKIQFPSHILKQNLSPEKCFQAVDECGAPIVSIPGGEPLLHPQMPEIVAGLVARKKFIYLCTNAILLEKHLENYPPSKYLTFSIHLDGIREDHDAAVCRDGIYDKAISAIKAAVKAGHRVTTNSTLFENAEPERVRQMFDELAELGIESMMLSPGYQYEKAPDQEHFLKRNQTIQKFREILTAPKKPWGNPTYNIFGWQKPCYLLEEGYAETFAELMSSTRWEQYGRKSGNSKCQDCMVHCGHEPTAVDQTFSSWKGFLKVASLTLFGSRDSHKPLPTQPKTPMPSPHYTVADHELTKRTGDPTNFTLAWSGRVS